MEDLYNAHDIETASNLLEQLDGEEMARKANAITRGSQTASGAMKLIRLVLLAALRTPGQTVTVAGFSAVQNGDKLEFSLLEEIASEAVSPPTSFKI